MTIRLRQGRYPDFPVLAEIWRQAWQLTYPDIDFSARLPFILGQLGESAGGRYRLQVAEVDSVPAGFSLLEIKTNLLEQIVVAPSAWGQGIAQTLLRDAMQAGGASFHLVVNQFNARAIAFYRKQGLAVTAEGVNAAGRPTFTMRRAAPTP